MGLLRKACQFLAREILDYIRRGNSTYAGWRLMMTSRTDLFTRWGKHKPVLDSCSFPGQKWVEAANINW